MRIRLDSRQLREVIRLHFDSRLNLAELQRSTGLHRSTLQRLCQHFEQLPDLVAGFWQGLNDEQLMMALQLQYARDYRLKPIPDWGWVHEEMRDPDISLELLWQEWRRNQPDGIAYAQFTAGYRAFRRSLPLVMRQVHRPGEKLFLDFGGRTILVHLPGLPEPRPACLFVAVLGYSSQTFVKAVWSQKIHDWLQCHVEALRFFGGVPKFFIPDNLKAAVIRHGKDGIQLNSLYRQLAEHYRAIILPARPRKPKDKAKVETGVRLVQRLIAASLRHRTFLSLEELNEAIQPLLLALNQRAFRQRPGSRESLFRSEEQPYLQALPQLEYEIADWQFNIRIKADYHVEIQPHLYSVPATLIHQRVDIRITAHAIEVFHQHQRVASHERKFTFGMTTLPEHRPPSHQHYQALQPDGLLQWAESVGPGVLAHIQHHLSARSDLANGHKAAMALRKEAKLHGEARLEEACAYACRINSYSLRSVRSILLHSPDKMPPAILSPAPTESHENLRGAEYFGQGVSSC